ncbi:MAG: hypothetical protein LBV14_15420 [Acidovorax sp.]|jgi:hypothetical protein|nr:hypothetical protein [Acidovorax sp.]
MARPRKTTTSTEALATAATHPQEQQELQAPTEEQAKLLELSAGYVMGNAAGTAQPEPVAPEWLVEPLDEFLRRVERVHIERDVVATAATHPQATETTWPGTYGGIRLSAGPASVTYSDGSTE